MASCRGLRALVALGFGLMLAASAFAAPPAASQPRVAFDTTDGRFVVELYPDKAPVTVKNFLTYVRAGFYDGTIFHRVIQGFVIQGGGYTARFARKPTHAPIRDEADNGLQNRRGTIAMARTADPDSATSQFFINLADNPPLNYRSPAPAGAGYAVFGKVVKGMDVVDRIAASKTGPAGPFPQDVPQPLVVIRHATVLGAGKAGGKH